MHVASGTTLAAIAVATLVSTGSTHAQDRDFEWSGRVAAGKAVEVFGVNGSIRATGSSGTEVEVTARIHEGRRGDADDVTVEVVEHDGGVTICALYPSRRNRVNQCRPGGGGQDVDDNDTKVHFTVRVPGGVNFVGGTVNGDVDATGIGGNADVQTVNGSITVEAAGYAEARTVNGSIRASMGRSDWRGPLEFRTVNGSITVELPEGIGADVRASTVNGDIDTDFPLTVSGRFNRRRLNGTIGGGGRTLSLETVNGGINLRRRG